MKSFITFVLLFGSALAAKYPAGATCRTNTECDGNCINKQWTIANRDGAYVFACDPNVADSTVYFAGECRSSTTLSVLPTRYNTQKTASTCEKFGGQLCAAGCVITTTKSAVGDTSSSWTKACADLGAQGRGASFESKKGADVFARCGTSSARRRSLS
jgi:hypothetical protein